MKKLRIGITIGDINGVGPEVIIKALSRNSKLKNCILIVYGSSKVIAYHKNIVKNVDFVFSSIYEAENAYHNKINVLNCWDDAVNINLGMLTEEGGKYAGLALERAVKDAKEGKIDAIVTAPINKKAMKMSGFEFPGHTEFLANRFETKNSLMMMVSDSMKVALVCNHTPIFEIKNEITRESITAKMNTLHKSLRQDFGIEKPTLAVLGLNPHAGDEGAIGSEEEEFIRPVIIEAKKKGVLAMGPFPADGFFGSSQFSKVDGILAMYHDQGLIPFKALSFGDGVNYTAGLPVVRTSPDHGTAYDLAGRDMANHSSMRNALSLAVDLVKNKIDYKYNQQNGLQKSSKTVNNSE
jgi:4-hydroxythreonine-4-phosphate dehydrogenase